MRTKLTHLLQRYGVWVYFFAWFVYFGVFWSRAVTVDKLGNFVANHVNIWGDWAAHFTMGSSLGYRSLWLTDSPLLVGARFSYPYFNDWISGLLLKLGADFGAAFTVPSFLASCFLVVALFYFFKTLFNSKTIAILASLIFLLNGGLGFIYFGQDIAASTNPWSTFLNPPHEYTRIDDQGIKWLSVIDSMVIPQRAFTLGFPLTVVALTLIYQAIYIPEKNLRRNYAKLIVAGIILGVMPLVHTHSFLSAGIILSFWMVGDVWQHQTHYWAALKKWLLLGSISLVLAVPIFLFFFANQVHGFIQWYPGWLAQEYNLNWLVFWVLNWGLTPLLAVIGYLVWLKKQTQFKVSKLPKALLFAPFFILFILANLFLFQPFSWDNTKLIVWAALGFSGLVGYVLYIQWPTTLGKILVPVLFVVTIASGSIDAYRIVRTDLHQYQMYSAEEMALSDWVKTATPPEAVWLTGTQHNHWLFNLTGRQAVMTYPGWLWTHGYDYVPVENDVRSLYANPQNREVIEKYDIEYVVVGPEEERHLGAKRSEWQLAHPEIKTTQNYSLFQVQ